MSKRFKGKRYRLSENELGNVSGGGNIELTGGRVVKPVIYILLGMMILAGASKASDSILKSFR